MSVKQFTPKTVYDHQVFIDVMNARKKQDNVKTDGPKCKRCAYDITWNMDRALELWQKRLPFERDFDVQHVCDKDEQDYHVIRSGYVIKDDKAVCVIPGQQQSTGTSSPQSQQKTFSSSRIPSPPLQGVSQGPDIYSIESMIKEQISELSQHYMAFQDEYKSIVQTQSQEILTLKGIITEYIQHNPTEGVLKTLISELIRYLPEPALRPRSASELKDALNIPQETPELSSGYRRGEYQNQFSNDNDREAGFESTQ